MILEIVPTRSCIMASLNKDKASLKSIYNFLMISFYIRNVLCKFGSFTKSRLPFPQK